MKTIVQAYQGFSVVAAYHDDSPGNPEPWWVDDFPVIAWEIDGEEREPITISEPIGCYASAIAYNGRVLMPDMCDTVEIWLGMIKGCFKTKGGMKTRG